MEDLLKTANQELFIDVHRKLISHHREKLILFNCGGLISVKLDGKEIYQKEDYRPALYHRLKEICHLYVATYFQTIQFNQEQSDKLISVLRKLLNKINELDIPTELFPAQLGIISACLNILLKKSDESDEFDEMNKTVIKFVNKNIEYATKLQLDTLHQIIQDIKKKVSPNEWDHVKVIVMGRPVHRVGDVSMQYFGRLTGKKQEELSGFFSSGWIPSDEEIIRKATRGLIYAENISTIEQAEFLLSEHIIAEKLGNDIFGNPLRLQYDLLAKAASDHLKSQCVHNHHHN